MKIWDWKNYIPHLSWFSFCSSHLLGSTICSDIRISNGAFYGCHLLFPKILFKFHVLYFVLHIWELTALQLQLEGWPKPFFLWKSRPKLLSGLFFDSKSNVRIVTVIIIVIIVHSMGWGRLGYPCSETAQGNLKHPHPSWEQELNFTVRLGFLFL